MTDLPITQTGFFKQVRRVPGSVWTVAIATIIFGVIWQLTLTNYPDADLRFRIDLSRLLTIPLVLQIHIASALLAFFIGLWILAGPKGRGMHKKLGWIWVIAMTSTAVSSFWLTGINGDKFSWIHGLSAWTLIGLPMGIYAIRKKQVQKHAKNMKGMFLGAMIIAGLFTFLPGRTMWHLFFTI